MKNLLLLFFTCWQAGLAGQAFFQRSYHYGNNLSDAYAVSRWGQKVFDTTDPAETWDGTMDRQDLPSDVYAWVVHYAVTKNGESVAANKKGSISLLR